MKQLTILAMTEKGYAVVTAIMSAYPEIVGAVVAARDPNVANDYFDEIAEFCKTNAIPFDDGSEDYVIRTEYVLAVSWRWIVNHTESRLIVLHDSLLPKYRGFNPLVTALLNGDSEIGVTALYATSEYDRGDIIAQSASEISYPIRIQDAIDTILTNYRTLALGVAESLRHGVAPVASPQCEADASYSLWRDEEDYYIDWTMSATAISKMVDTLSTPYRGAASVIDGKVARILEAQVIDDVMIANRTCGKVIFAHDSGPIVVCGEGLLQINVLTDDSGNSLLPLARFRTRFKAYADART